MLSSMRKYLALIGLSLVLIVPGFSVRAAGGDEGDEFFEQKVRPLLIAKCFECHGETEPEGGLRLTSRIHLLKGGDSGPAAVLKQPDASRLLQAVLQTGPLKMPPNGKLTDDEIALLARWIELGIPWPQSTGPVVVR